MANFTTDAGVTIAYDDHGPSGARPLLMLHGFSSNRVEGWKRTGWFGACERRGQRALAMDLRGHGESFKPHDPAQYASAILAGDVLALMDHLNVEIADLLGFSMGSAVAFQVAKAAPHRVSNLILAGVGGRWLHPEPHDDHMALAMEADDPADIEDLLSRSFRHFADEQGEDRLALAACSRAPRTALGADDFYALTVPTLVIAGARDELAGDPRELADAIPGARSITVPGCNHFALITHGMAKGAVFDFLDGWLEEM
jgi:pimeloyl-ACP methyl ester carboxylesterase